MATVTQIRQRVSPLLIRENLYEVVFEVVRRFEFYLIDFQLVQLESGQDRDKKLVGRYTKRTAEIALFGDGPKPIRPKIEGEPYNFQWTGGFFDGMYLEIKGQEARFFSRDEKAYLLEDKYKNIFGLQDRYLKEAIENKLGPAFAKLVKEKICKK